MTALSPSPAATGQGLDAASLFERYGQELYRFCLGRLRNPEDAADALQNTFLRVHVALEKGTVPQFEAAWLYKIAHNVCLSRIEQGGRRSAHESATDFEEMEYALAAPEHDHDRLEGLADALADLPHNLRQSLLLREWQGLSYAEIADALDTTVPAVETLLYRARKQLATALEQGRASLAGLLDVLGIRAILARLSGALSGAGAAKIAVGAALLAAGGAGLGTAVAVETAAPAKPPAAQQHSSAATQQHTLAQVAAARVATPRTTHTRPARTTSVPAPASPSSGSSAPPAAQTPAGTLAHAATAPASVQTAVVATIPAVAPSVPALVAPPTLTAPTSPTAPTVPAAPAAPSLPTLPTATTPTAEAPSVTTPSLPTLPAAPTLPSTPTLPSLP